LSAFDRVGRQFTTRGFSLAKGGVWVSIKIPGRWLAEILTAPRCHWPEGTKNESSELSGKQPSTGTLFFSLIKFSFLFLTNDKSTQRNNATQ